MSKAYRFYVACSIIKKYECYGILKNTYIYFDNMNTLKTTLVTFINLILTQCWIVLLNAPEEKASTLWTIIAIFVFLLTTFSSFYMWKFFARFSHIGKITFLLLFYIAVVYSLCGLCVGSSFIDIISYLLSPIYCVVYLAPIYLGGIILLILQISNKRNNK